MFAEKGRKKTGTNHLTMEYILFTLWLVFAVCVYTLDIPLHITLETGECRRIGPLKSYLTHKYMLTIENKVLTFHKNNHNSFIGIIAAAFSIVLHILEIHVKQLFDTRYKYCPQIGEDTFIRRIVLITSFLRGKRSWHFHLWKKVFFMKYC